MQPLACAAMLMLVLVAGGAPPAPAQAITNPFAPPASASGQGAGASGNLSADALEQLSRTLKDPQRRKQFLQTLDGLIAAQRVQDEKEAPARNAADRLLAQLSDRFEKFGTRIGQFAAMIQKAPLLLPWAQRHLSAPGNRDRVLEFLWRLAAIIAFGLLVEQLVRRLVAPGRRRVERPPPGYEGAFSRLLRFVMRLVLLYAVALSYGGGAYLAFEFLRLPGLAGRVMVVAAGAFLVDRLILASVRVLVAPRVGNLRPVPVGDETASYLYVWARRLVRIFVYGFFLIEVLGMAGLPEPAYTALQYLLGIALVGFLLVFVMQNRAAVAGAIRGRRGGTFYGSVRARFAATWHLFAILYIVGIYLVWVFQIEGGFDFLLRATALTVLILIAAKVVVAATFRGIDRTFRISDGLTARYPGLEARANSYLPLLKLTFQWIVYLFALFVALEAWGVDTLGWLGSEGGVFLHRGLIILAVVVAAGIAWEMLDLIITRRLQRLEDTATGSARARTLLPLLRTSLLIVIVVISALVVLSEVGVNIGPLLAGAGVIGLAIGFGSQRLVQDVITGLFMLVEDTLAIGDVVQFDADHSGVVDGMSIRSVRLRDTAGHVHTLPFSEVKTVLNMTKDYAYFVIEVGISYREDIDRVIEVLRDITEGLRKDEALGKYIVDPLEVLGVGSMNDWAVIIQARIKVRPPINQWSVGREFNRRMKMRFDAEGIEVGFPRHALYFDEHLNGKGRPPRIAIDTAEHGAGHGSRPVPAESAGRATEQPSPVAEQEKAMSPEKRASEEAKARARAEEREAERKDRP